MQASYNDDDVIVDPIEDPIWEPPQKGPASVSMDHGMQARPCGNVL